MDRPSGRLAKLEKLKRSRTGKKGSITKRLEQLNGMAEAGGCSRRQMKYLMEKLMVVFEELQKVCEEIADISLLENVSEENNDIENVRFNVDSCVALVIEHLESRQDEAPSSDSARTMSWVASSPFAASDASGGPKVGNSDISSVADGPRSRDNFSEVPTTDIHITLKDNNPNSVVSQLSNISSDLADVDSVPTISLPLGVLSNTNASNISPSAALSKHESAVLGISGHMGEKLVQFPWTKHCSDMIIWTPEWKVQKFRIRI